jgi:hypothetical protein
MRTLLVFVLLASIASADPKLIVRPDAFETLVNPNCSHCIDEAKRRKDELKDSDPVLMWTRGKYDGGAMPYRYFLNPYRVISDTYGVFVYDPDAGFSAFCRSLDFKFHGWRRRYGDDTGWNALSCLSASRSMARGATRTLAHDGDNWGWVMKRIRIRCLPHIQPRNSQNQSKILSSRGKIDKRLPTEEPVLGVPSAADHIRELPDADLERKEKPARRHVRMRQ